MSSIEDQSGEDIPGRDDLARCAPVLRALRAVPARAVAKDPAIAEVRAEANRLIAAVQQHLGAARASASRGESQAARRDHDHTLLDYRPTTW